MDTPLTRAKIPQQERNTEQGIPGSNSSNPSFYPTALSAAAGGQVDSSLTLALGNYCRNKRLFPDIVSATLEQSAKQQGGWVSDFSTFRNGSLAAGGPRASLMGKSRTPPGWKSDSHLPLLRNTLTSTTGRWRGRTR